MKFRDGENLPAEYDIMIIFADDDTRGLIGTEASEQGSKQRTDRPIN